MKMIKHNTKIKKKFANYANYDNINNDNNND